MPSKKDLKRLVRARMARTGESYTTARAHITREKLRLPPDYRKLVGIPEAKLVERTGRSWREWVEILDEAGATEMAHPEIARWLRKHHDVGSWWCQSVTVGYERIRGLRAVGQGRDGYFTANKSRTVPYAEDHVRRAVHDAALRERWLPKDEATPSGRGQAKDLRFRCPDGTKGLIAVVSKGEAKATVVVSHEKLPSDAERTRRRAYWEERLEALEDLLRADG
jgi:hypothetical protein